jgi:hypothetical protein
VPRQLPSAAFGDADCLQAIGRGGLRAARAGLHRAARVAVADCLGVRQGERVLIVTNPVRDTSLSSRALYDAVL